jgi:hypothetical protein
LTNKRKINKRRRCIEEILTRRKILRCRMKLIKIKDLSKLMKACFNPIQLSKNKRVKLLKKTLNDLEACKTYPSG